MGGRERAPVLLPADEVIAILIDPLPVDLTDSSIVWKSPMMVISSVFYSLYEYL